MAQKYIIEDNVIKFGDVKYHEDLATDRKKVIGGGRYYYDRFDKKLFIYHTSDDFGSVSQESFQKALDNNKNVLSQFKEGISIIFTNDLSVKDCMDSEPNIFIR